MAAPFTLPSKFLTNPGPQVEKQLVDFKNSDIPEYEDCYACILDNVLSPSECADLIKAAKAQTNGEWGEAMIDAGYGRQELDTETRLCGRIIWDDKQVVSKIWNRCKDHVPELLELKDKPGVTGSGSLMKNLTFEMVRCNERMRFLRYFDGNYFRPHFDGTYVAEKGVFNMETSFITMHLYLNEADEESLLQGGATSFHAIDWSGQHVDIVPKVGRVLLFQQKGLLHSGADVTRGVKYTMRTDVMYRGKT